MDKNRIRRIVLDMDETMCNLIAPCIDKCRTLWPEQQWKLPKYGRYSKWFNDHLSEEQKDVLYAIVKTEEFYLSLPPVLSPLHNSSVEKLSAVCWSLFDHVDVVTARVGWCPNPEETSREWLRINGFTNTDKITVTAIDGATCKTSKVKGPSLFVDDSLSVADAVASSRDHHMIMVNQPWNDGYARRINVTVAQPRNLISAIRIFKDSVVV